MPFLSFPPGFLWGTATAAFQIEGAVREDGRGESIWDRFSHTPGRIDDASTGDIADDHYYRYREDVRLMKDLGHQAYRFSISWPRVMPEGRGEVNEAGLDFYQRLVEALLEASIQPFVTLYHWDLPQVLQDQGGWANRDTARYFAEYADIVARRLGDRVDGWITHNEPWVAAFQGNYFGVHAPGARDLATAVQIGHHLLLSHGLAVQAIRASDARAQVGITLNFSPVHPATDADADSAAVRRYDGFLNRWFLDPLYRGEYPADMVDLYGASAPVIADGDMGTIAVPTDFLGANYYFRTIVADDPDDQFPGVRSVRPEGAEYTAMGWEVYPSGLYELLMRLHSEFHVPKLYITENGAAFPDIVDEEGQMNDPRRLAYLESHLVAVHHAFQDGAPLAGYFVWSLMDNFEWAKGYGMRFGIVYVDYATQQRLPKTSGYWYREVIRQNGVLLP